MGDPAFKPVLVVVLTFAIYFSRHNTLTIAFQYNVLIGSLLTGTLSVPILVPVSLSRVVPDEIWSAQ